MGKEICDLNINVDYFFLADRVYLYDYTLTSVEY